MLIIRVFHSPEEDRSDEIQHKDDGNGDGGHVHGAVGHPGGELIEEGLDAVLVQDFGVLQFIRKEFPQLPVHASTQMSVQSADGARMLKGLGLTRIVPARTANNRI